MRTIETKVYTIEEHPNKDLCFEYIRNNWHDLNYIDVEETINSLKALKDIIGGRLDYSISSVPDRSEHITFKDYDKETLFSLNEDDCILTGSCFDYDVIKGLKEGNIERVLNIIHNQTEYIYSDEGLMELCEANEYEFTEEGNCI